MGIGGFFAGFFGSLDDAAASVMPGGDHSAARAQRLVPCGAEENAVLDPIIEALRTNNRINLMLFDAIDKEGMACTLSKRGGRDVLRQFAHMHDVRRMQIEARGRKLGIELEKFPVKEPLTRARIRKALVVSSKALERFFSAIDAGEANCMKKGPLNYLAYFVAHDAHHRGIIMATLKERGLPVPKDVRYGVWDWGRL